MDLPGVERLVAKNLNEMEIEYNNLSNGYLTSGIGKFQASSVDSCYLREHHKIYKIHIPKYVRLHKPCQSEWTRCSNRWSLFVLTRKNKLIGQLGI